MKRTRTHVRLAMLAGLALSMAACESTDTGKKGDLSLNEPVPAARRAPAVFDPGDRTVTRALDISDAVYASPDRGPRLVSRVTLDDDAPPVAGEGFDANETPSQVIKVRYEAEEANVQEIIAVLIGDFLDRDYVIDPTIAGLVNISIDEEMTEPEIERFVGGLCTLYGLRLSEQDGRFIVQKGAARNAQGGTVPVDAPIYTAEPLMGNVMPAIRLRKLRYADGEQIKSVLQELMSEGALISTSGDLLVMVDTTRQIKRVSGIVAALDVPAFRGTEMRLYELSSISAEQAQQTLSTLVASTGLAGNDTSVSFVEMPTGDRELLMIAKDPSVARQAENLIRLVDRPSDSPARGRYIYTAQHTSASSLIDAFESYFPDRMEQSPDDPSDAGVRFVSFGVSAASAGVGGGGANAGARTLLIHSTPKDYEDMLTLFRQLDRPPQQVNMRIVVAEVGLTKDLEFGVEYFLNAQTGEGDFDFLGTPGAVASATGSIFFTATDGFAVVEALDSIADTRLISSPNISAVSGGSASINVGGEEPIPAGETVAASGNVTDTIERRETGITVEAQPTVNESGEIRIVLNIDIADLGPDRGAELGPSFTTRILETEILAKHGQTYLIGGIIIDGASEGRRSIPGLGDLPIIGAAFGMQDDSYDRTELLIAVTPTIANTPDEADVFMSEFMRSTHAVREMLTKQEEDLARGFLFDRVREPEWVPPMAAPPAIEPDAIEQTLPPFVREMLKTPGTQATPDEGR